MSQVAPAHRYSPYGQLGYGAMAVYSCDNCSRLLLALGTVIHPTETVLTEDSADSSFELEWLPRGFQERHFDDVPEHIASAATEAYACLDIGAARAAVQLVRSVVEATAKEKGIVEGRLYDKIEAMFSSGLVREHIRDAAHEIRHLGNEMAHGDFVEPVSTDEAEEIVHLMAEVLEEVFQSPARVARRRQARLSKQDGS